MQTLEKLLHYLLNFPKTFLPADPHVIPQRTFSALSIVRALSQRLQGIVLSRLYQTHTPSPLCNFTQSESEFKLLYVGVTAHGPGSMHLTGASDRTQILF